MSIAEIKNLINEAIKEMGQEDAYLQKFMKNYDIEKILREFIFIFEKC